MKVFERGSGVWKVELESGASMLFFEHGGEIVIRTATSRIRSTQDRDMIAVTTH